MQAVQEYSQTRALEITNFEAENGITYITIPISLKVYGKPLHSAPIILLNRGLLPGKSNKQFESFHKIVGKGKFVDLNTYTLIEFNIPTDRYLHLAFESYASFSTQDTQAIIDRAMEILEIPQPFASFRFD
ncbi:hypothetical protein U1E44_01935 [Arenibacter sp. GZD96]|uniref:hypothetical protein n=1 Tax=Aurantibrevibacter litoralis TaxID=3106030 RepID=UPI002AFEE752|nr:hypothetical protein [Arenibacter sp. GZD-96]MEA1784839.1 hypothetical protein [Arenibacter sp. GZD-96]